MIVETLIPNKLGYPLGARIHLPEPHASLQDALAAHADNRSKMTSIVSMSTHLIISSLLVHPSVLSPAPTLRPLSLIAHKWKSVTHRRDHGHVLLGWVNGLIPCSDRPGICCTGTSVLHKVLSVSVVPAIQRRGGSI